MEYTSKLMSETNLNKILFVNFGRMDVFSRPSRCNHVILVLCTEGELEVEINYVTYRLRKNSLVTLVPLDIATLKSGSDDFMCKALLIPHSVYSPMIATFDISHFKDIKTQPVVNYASPYIDILQQFFSMLETANKVLEYEEFEPYAMRLVSALFVVQKSYFKSISKDNLAVPGVVVRKKELFRKFIEAIVGSFTVSREVLYYANELGVSSGYLNEVCNDVSGHSAKDIIDQAVSSRLKYELSYTCKTIQELADEYNFPSQSYFSRYYKRMTGMTPSEFRKKRLGIE